MPLLSLPNEILLLIGETLGPSKDLSCFVLACQHLHALLTPLLWRLGTTEDDDGAVNILLWAACRGSVPVASALSARYGSEILARPINGYYSALHTSARSGHVEVSRFFLERGADPEAYLPNGLTPLHFAVVNGKAEVVELLLSCGATVTASRDNGWSVLHAAASNGQDGLAALLIAHGADVNARMSDDWFTPLHCAADGGHRDICAVLLDHGADINATTVGGETALLHAALVAARMTGLGWQCNEREVATARFLKSRTKDMGPTIAGMRVIDLETRKNVAELLEMPLQEVLPPPPPPPPPRPERPAEVLEEEEEKQGVPLSP